MILILTKKLIKLQLGSVKTLNFCFFLSSFNIAFREPYSEKRYIELQLYRAVSDDSKLKVSHTTEKTTLLLEMLKSWKDANKTMRSIQNIITDSKRNKEIDHPKTRHTLDSDKQKQILRKTRTKSYHRHDVG